MELIRNGYKWESYHKTPFRLIHELIEQLNEEKIKEYRNGQRQNRN